MEVYDLLFTIGKISNEHQVMEINVTLSPQVDCSFWMRVKSEQYWIPRTLGTRLQFLQEAYGVKLKKRFHKHGMNDMFTASIGLQIAYGQSRQTWEQYITLYNNILNCHSAYSNRITCSPTHNQPGRQNAVK